ncbi:MAG: hypothetical protein U0996_12800 [Planctomycetaceae bacterium]
MKENRLQEELKEAVNRSFVARQELHRAELAEFALRLREIQESIDRRDKIREQIVAHRMEELLDPSLGWDNPGNQSDYGTAAFGKDVEVSSGHDGRPLTNRQSPDTSAADGTQPVRVGSAILTRQQDGTITISTGSHDGVLVGDRFQVSASDRTIGDIEVTTVQPSESTARILSESANLPIRQGDIVMQLPRTRQNKRVVVRALIFDAAESAELVDLSKSQRPTPQDFNVLLRALNASKQITFLAEPNLVTELESEASFVSPESAAPAGDDDPGNRLFVTPFEENGNPLLKVRFEFGRVSEQADPIGAVELAVRTEYRGNGVLLGPFKAVPGKNRFIHLRVSLVDDDADMKLRPRSTVQVVFEKQKIGSVQIENGGENLRVQSQDTFRIDVDADSTARLRVAQVDGYPDAQLYVQVRAIDLSHLKTLANGLSPADVLAKNMISVGFTEDDFRQAMSGCRLSGLVFLSRQMKSADESPFELIISTQRDPAGWKVKQAQANGFPVATVTLSNAPDLSTAELQSMETESADSHAIDTSGPYIRLSPVVCNLSDSRLARYIRITPVVVVDIAEK